MTFLLLPTFPTCNSDPDFPVQLEEIQNGPLKKQGLCLSWCVLTLLHGFHLKFVTFTEAVISMCLAFSLLKSLRKLYKATLVAPRVTVFPKIQARAAIPS